MTSKSEDGGQFSPSRFRNTSDMIEAMQIYIEARGSTIAAKDAEIETLRSTTQSDQALIERLREALEDARRSVKNARGAVESNQVVDKDVHGTLSGVIRRIDAALKAQGTEERG